MQETMTAIELTGVVDEERQLRLDQPLPFSGPKQVRVIVLYSQDDDLNEDMWLRAAATNPAFASLEALEEDIYSLEGGQPFHDAKKDRLGIPIRDEYVALSC